MGFEIKAEEAQGVPCKWLLKSIQMSCAQCMDKHIKCMMGSISISHWAPQKHADLPSKRCHITMLEVLEMDSDAGKVWRPTLMEGDQASSAIAHMLGDLVEVQEGIQMEMECLHI